METIIGIIIGGIITILASRYFFKKSIRIRRLSFYTDFVSEIMSISDKSIKEQLEIRYNGEKLDNIFQAQLVIANNGDIAISDILEPLVLHIPKTTTILDINIIHIEPSARRIDYSISNDKSRVLFNFQFLNSGEFFVVKLLLKGSPTELYKDYNYSSLFKLSISSPDLPPEIVSEQLPLDQFESEHRTIDPSMLYAGGIFGLITLILGYALYSLSISQMDFFLFDFQTFFSNFSIQKTGVLLGWVLTLSFGLISILFPASQLTKIKFGKRDKFDLSKMYK